MYLFKDCCKRQLGNRSIMEDANGNLIQETGQKQRPARMVGLIRLDSSQNPAWKLVWVTEQSFFSKGGQE